jgi:RNA polymerase sigma factor (sigma-70 family)
VRAITVFSGQLPDLRSIVTIKSLDVEQAGLSVPGRRQECLRDVTAEDANARFERLLDTYSGLLRRLIRQHCPRDLGIQISDIEQEARLRLWRALEREKEFDSPASYVYRIAVSATIDAVRRVMARREDQLRTVDSIEDEEMVAPHEPPVDDRAESPHAMAERHELMDRIGRAVASLPENRRRVVELHLQGLGLDDIAALLGWTAWR